MSDTKPALRLENIVKAFPGVRALDGVSFEVIPGEVHALMGENGAGKSTLMKVLGGIYQPNEGTIYIEEQETVMHSPLQAKGKGVVFIHQELSLADELSVAENIFLGELPRKSFGRVDWDALYKETDAILGKLNVGFNAKTRVGDLSIANQQMVEIARALASGPQFILLDEPLAGIDPIAVGEIRDLISHLTDRGLGVLITDHNVRETLEIVDRAYILHDGMVLMEGSPDDIVGNRDVRRFYLGERFSL